MDKTLKISKKGLNKKKYGKLFKKTQKVLEEERKKEFREAKTLREILKENNLENNLW
jgi:hypothetical protein